jgi:hypothetical protein
LDSAAPCSSLVDALEGKTDIMRVWREAVDASCRNNTQPNVCVSTEIANSQKPNGMAWVRYYLLYSAWNNCANNYVRAFDSGGAIPDRRAALEKRFRRLFKVREVECDEP